MQNLLDHGIQHEGVRAVQQQVSHVIAGGRAPEQDAVQRVAQLAERQISAHVGGVGEHPSDVFPSKTEMGIIDDIHIVIPIDEAGPDDRPKGGHDRRGQQKSQQPIESAGRYGNGCLQGQGSITCEASVS